jgi:DNA modification methylase
MEDFLQGSGVEKDFHKWGQGTPEAEYLIKQLTKPGDTICDPFFGGGTVALACQRTGGRFIGCDIDPENVTNAKKRIAVDLKNRG